MAQFSPISTNVYQLSYNGKKYVQASIKTKDYEFQHTDNFAFYKPNQYNWINIPIFGKEYMYLRSELTDSLWESVHMKCCYILAAAAGWKGDTAPKPFPVIIPDKKYEEIDMINAPFPPDTYLSYNFLKIPKEMATIKSWIKKWQQTSHQLSAWIAKAKENMTHSKKTSWK